MIVQDVIFWILSAMAVFAALGYLVQFINENNAVLLRILQRLLLDFLVVNQFGCFVLNQ